MNTMAYQYKIQKLLYPTMYTMLTKDLMQSIVRKTDRLIIESSLAQEVIMGLQGTEALRLY